MTFLATHYTIERWREALLWSWIVGRIGGDEDEWGEKERARAVEELGDGGGTRRPGEDGTGTQKGDMLSVFRRPRGTMDKMKDVEGQVGNLTKILFGERTGPPYNPFPPYTLTTTIARFGLGI